MWQEADTAALTLAPKPDVVVWTRQSLPSRSDFPQAMAGHPLFPLCMRRQQGVVRKRLDEIWG